MTEAQKPKIYDIEDRTLKFSKDIIVFTSSLPRTIANIELMKQLVRSATSVGANYIEANESLSKKDFGMRIRICRKEAKESGYWLELIQINGEEAEDMRLSLMKEANEIAKIFGAIVEKTK